VKPLLRDLRHTWLRSLLFAAGYAFGRLTGRRPTVMGVEMVVLGSVLVGLTIALGG
jgi:VIT1/CCC1 family predicted Fe2+/Mn2+ transporter